MNGDLLGRWMQPIAGGKNKAGEYGGGGGKCGNRFWRFPFRLTLFQHQFDLHDFFAQLVSSHACHLIHAMAARLVTKTSSVSGAPRLSATVQPRPCGSAQRS